MPDIIEVPAEDNRPKFFKNCPVCGADTPAGSIACPKCGVNLEIARANVMKGITLEAGKVGYVAGQFSATPPKKKITLWTILGWIGICFLLLLVYGFLKDTVFMPYTPTATNRPPVSTLSPLEIYDLTQNPNANHSNPPTHEPCLRWSEVTPEMEGLEVCVYGVVKVHRSNYQLKQTFFYFDSDDKFFITSKDGWSQKLDGTCISANGVVQLNTYKVPYILISGDELYTCATWMQ